MSTRRKSAFQKRQFTFVNLTDPVQAEHEIIRKQVRSAAAFEGWAETRKSETEIPVVVRKKKSKSRKFDSVAESDSSTSPPECSETRHDSKSHEIVLNLKVLGSGNSDPFRACPVESQPWFGWVMDYLRTTIAPRGLRALHFSSNSIKQHLEFTDSLMMDEPAMFYMCLFRSASILLSQGLLSPEATIWLRGQTIKSIRDALCDPRRATSDAMILTVACISAHECIYGDKDESINIHARAYRHMIELVGGLEDWQTRTIMKQMIIRYDNTVAHLTGTERAYSALQHKYDLGHLDT